MRQAHYRIHQFLRHLRRAPLSPSDLAVVEATLGPALASIFLAMTPGEQAHSLAVLRCLEARGHTRPELLQAALLHDVGKTVAPMNILGRVAVVMAQRLFPSRWARWGEADPVGWRRPFVTARRHPDWGALLAARGGAAPLTVNLIRRHQAALNGQASSEDELLRFLQEADRSC